MRRREFIGKSIGLLTLLKGADLFGELFQGRDPFMPLVPSLDLLVERLSSDRELLRNGVIPEEIRSYFGRKEFKFDPRVVEKFLDNPEKQGKEGKLTYHGYYTENKKYVEGYRDKHKLDELIKQGPVFFKENNDALLGAEAKYGVDARYITAILGVESTYGLNKGIYLAFNALSSIYIEPNDEDKLQKYRLSLKLKSWAYEQLKSLLIFSKKSGRDALEIKSSYAGAIGPAQFIPESLMRYFVGKNGDFKAGPSDMDDSIYSIGFYMIRKGRWKAESEKNIPQPGSNNWRAIWRYNNSDMYVKAVVELATMAEWKSLIKPKTILVSREMEWC